LIKPCNIVAVFHGHDHHADHYRWPDPKRHADDLLRMFPDGARADFRQYDVVFCGNLCWVMRVKGDQLLGVHYRAGKWASGSSLVLKKSLLP
jgi:hypothetical protein